MKHLIEPLLWLVIILGAAHTVNRVYEAAYYLPHTPFAAVGRMLEGK